MFGLAQLQNLPAVAEDWLLNSVFSWPVLAQLGGCAAMLAASWLLARRLNRRLAASNRGRRLVPARFRRSLRPLTWPVCFLAMLGLSVLLVRGAGMTEHGRVLAAAASLSGAWVAIRLSSSAIGNGFAAGVVALAVWTVAALHITGLLGPTAALLDAAAFKVGQSRLSLLAVIKGAALLAAMLWGASTLSALVERRLAGARDLTPSAKVLIGKSIRYASFAVAVFVAVNATGVDLTALAVFTGALGVGIGFGLQKPASNLVSGMILLLDKSIKPGDVIELPSGAGGTTFGCVSHMGARYTEITNHDGKSYLVPNEELLTTRVVNWSHQNPAVRCTVAFDVSRDADPEAVIRIAVAAAQGIGRVQKDDPPVCALASIRGYALEFRLRFWVPDPQNGLSNVTSDVLVALWRALRENGIEVPYPQQRVVVVDERPAPSAGRQPVPVALVS